MSRPLRIQFPDAHYHICARGNERRRIFWRDKDYKHFCSLLEKTSAKFELFIFAFALMPNHFHLMLKTPLGNLSSAMHWLKTSYSVWLNRSRSRVGHLFQGRYRSVFIENESHYLELSRYIHLNPVRAKIIELPEQYQWSSCHDYLNHKQKWNWIKREPILMELGGTDKKRFHRYYDFLYAGIEMDDSKLEHFRHGYALGSSEFRNWLSEKIHGESSEISGMSDICRNERLPCNEMRDRLIKEATKYRLNHRSVIMYLLHQLGYPLKDIGKIYEISYSAVSQNARRFTIDNKNEVAINKILSNVKR